MNRERARGKRNAKPYPTCVCVSCVQMQIKALAKKGGGGYVV